MMAEIQQQEVSFIEFCWDEPNGKPSFRPRGPILNTIDRRSGFAGETFALADASG